MFSSRHLIAVACAGSLLVGAASGSMAFGQGGGAQPEGLELLERPAKRFERSIEAHLQRVEAREERRRERRQARRERREAQLAGAAGELGVPRATLDAIAACESGGDPTAVNPAGYYGKYQFDSGTWQSVGGTGNPAEASVAEQDYRAALLYSRAGASPWPVCGA